MIYVTPRQFKQGEASHLPVIMEVVRRSEGPILELGTGLFSTPVFHWMCHDKKRKLVSYESDERFVEFAKKFASDFHEVYKIDDWDSLPVSGKWGIVFIDHAPGPRRNVEMVRFANNADYVVVHDTEPKSDWHYNYTKSFPSYKYRFDYTKAYPNTSVLSNFKDLNGFTI